MAREAPSPGRRAHSSDRRWRLMPCHEAGNFVCSSFPPPPTKRCMHTLLDWIHQIRDVRGIIAWGGYAGLTAIIFAETEFLIGFILPVDSLLVSAGLLAATTC